MSKMKEYYYEQLMAQENNYDEANDYFQALEELSKVLPNQLTVDDLEDLALEFGAENLPRWAQEKIA